MRQNLWKTLTFCTALAMTGLTPALVNAQDRPDDRRPDDHQVMKADIHRDEHKNDDADRQYVAPERVPIKHFGAFLCRFR